MANWIITASELWLEPFFERLKDELLTEMFIQADENPLNVLTKDGKPSSYMWLYNSGSFGRKISLYEYQPSRSGKHPKNFLRGFSGFLQTDDYAGYNTVENVTRVGCFTYARHYYTDTLKAQKKQKSSRQTPMLRLSISRKYSTLNPSGEICPWMKGRITESRN